jgi:hypothetical protein
VGDGVNRIRIGLVLTFVIGSLYSAFGLFESLAKFGLGIIVASMAAITYGLVDYVEERHDQLILDERDQVWCRRDDQ